MPEVVLQLLNVSRPHFHCKMLSYNVYIEAPKEPCTHNCEMRIQNRVLT